MKPSSCFTSVVSLFLSFVLVMQTSLAAIPLNPDDPGPTEAERYAQMVRTFEFWRDYDRRLDRTSFDPVALGRHLETAEAAIEWVQTQTIAIDYPGVLRGAHGVLQDRRGNQMDRTLLLAELLRAQGREVRLVSSEKMTATPFTGADGEPQDPWQLLDVEASGELFIQTLDEHFPEPGNERKRLGWVALEREENRIWQIQAERISQALGDLTGLDLLSPPRVDDLSTSAQTAWGVEWRTAQGWESAQIGRAPEGPLHEQTSTDRFSLDDWPIEEAHRLSIEVVAKTRHGAEINQTVLVDTELAVVDLDMPLVTIQFVPATGRPNDLLMSGMYQSDPVAGLVSAYQDVSIWVPMIRFDRESIIARGIQPDGTIVEDPFQPPTQRALRDAAGLLGGLSVRGGLTVQEEADTEWLGATIELTYHSPNRSTKSFTRTLFDRHDPVFAQATEERVGSPAEFQHFGAIGRETHFYLQSHMLSPQWFIDQLLSEVLAYQAVTEDLTRFPALGFEPLLARVQRTMPEPLLELLLQRFRFNDYRDGVVQNELGILALHIGQWPQGSDSMAFEQTLDIIHSGLTRGPLPRALPPGIADSVAEWRVYSDSGGSSAGAESFVSDLNNEALAWQVLRSAADWNDAMPARDEGIPKVFTEAWEQDRWVIASAPASDSNLAVGTFWWEVDPATGDALVRDLLGHGSSSIVTKVSSQGLFLIAQAISVESIAITITVGGFWMGLGVCMYQSMNFGCCLLTSGLLLGLGAGVGALMGVTAGMGFDIITSPLSPVDLITVDCPDLLEREREQGAS